MCGDSTAPGTFSWIACRKRDARAAVVPVFYAWGHLQDPGGVGSSGRRAVE
jgi:hypothetical protein